jgi:hypothetical protein
VVSKHVDEFCSLLTHIGMVTFDSQGRITWGNSQCE